MRDWLNNGRSAPLPWKSKTSLMLDIPGAEDPLRIRADLAHVWAIGAGKEFCASAILMLAEMKILTEGNGRPT